MDPHSDQMEHLLEIVGKAHRNRAFAGDAARYPWRTAEPQGISLTHRRFAWLRVAVPLAAAAAVAVLFVGPSLWHPRAAHELAEKSPEIGALENQEQPGAVEPVPTTGETVDCDYNGDGRVDGRDIQAFVDSLRDAGGDPRLETEYLQRCLLGG